MSAADQIVRSVKKVLAIRGRPHTLNDEQRRDLLEIIEDRYERRSTIVTSQVPVDRWYEIIGNPTIADAILLLSEGQMSDHKGARLVLNALPPAGHLIADRGYDSTWFRDELEARGIEPCIPSSRSRTVPYDYNKALYRQRHKVENLFAKLKDWRRIATRYDRCAHTFFSAICIAATLIFWINESSGNLWPPLSELKDGSHFWLSKAEGRKQP